MAEMLVDGAKLDACNTAEADAIRAKTGGTDPIPYDFTNNKGFADAIAAIPSGGGDTLESDFLVIRKETVVTGENTVSNTAQHYSYLNGLKSVSGTLFAVSMHPKASYQYNEIGNGLLQFNNPGYRYRSGWGSMAYNNASYDAIIVPGSIYYLYTVELINPRTV